MLVFYHDELTEEDKTQIISLLQDFLINKSK